MAELYIFLSLTTVIIFILTRDIFLSIEKREILIIKIDLTFFSISLFNTDKSRGADQKKDKNEKKSPDIAVIHRQIKRLLAFSEVKIVRLYLPILDEPESPHLLPFVFGNATLGYAIAAYIKSLAKALSIEEDAMLPSSDLQTVYHLILKAPLYRILYTISVIYKNKRKVV